MFGLTLLLFFVVVLSPAKAGDRLYEVPVGKDLLGRYSYWDQTGGRCYGVLQNMRTCVQNFDYTLHHVPVLPKVC